MTQDSTPPKPKGPKLDKEGREIVGKVSTELLRDFNFALGLRAGAERTLSMEQHRVFRAGRAAGAKEYELWEKAYKECKINPDGNYVMNKETGEISLDTEDKEKLDPLLGPLTSILGRG